LLTEVYVGVQQCKVLLTEVYKDAITHYIFILHEYKLNATKTDYEQTAQKKIMKRNCRF